MVGGVVVFIIIIIIKVVVLHSSSYSLYYYCIHCTPFDFWPHSSWPHCVCTYLPTLASLGCCRKWCEILLKLPSRLTMDTILRRLWGQTAPTPTTTTTANTGIELLLGESSISNQSNKQRQSDSPSVKTHDSDGSIVPTTPSIYIYKFAFLRCWLVGLFKESYWHFS